MVKGLLLPVLLCSSLPLAAAPSLDISLGVPSIDTHEYQRPYVAAWIEDANGKPVRTLALWRGEDDWLKDLRAFWRKVGRRDSQLVDALSSATRLPGNYQLSWDGKDDSGQLLPDGDYSIFFEAAREHGGRSILGEKLHFGGQAFTKTLAAKPELGPVTLSYPARSN